MEQAEEKKDDLKGMNAIIHSNVQKNYEKNVVDKCKDQPKLFSRFASGKLKTQNRWLVFNWYFNLEFTKEIDFREERIAMENGDILMEVVTST